MGDAPRTATSAFGVIDRLHPRLDALIAREATLEKVAEGIAWAEGPLWDATTGTLLFSDIPRNGIYRWHPQSGLSLFMERSGYTGDEPFTGREPGSNGLTVDAEGRLVFTQHGNRRIVRREPDGQITVIADQFDGKRFNSPNDLVYHSNGDLYFTDPPYGLPQTFDDPSRELPFQGVYRVTPQGKVTLLLIDLEAPNGIAFSPDEQTLYVSNSLDARPVWMAYSVKDDGTVGSGRQFAEASRWVGEGAGLPDGMKVDMQGNIFAAGPGGVHVYAPGGTRLGRIGTGVPTGNVAWGEEGALYIAANHWICRIQTSTRPAAELKGLRAAT